MRCKIIMAGCGNVTDSFLKIIEKDNRFEIYGLFPDYSIEYRSDYYTKIMNRVTVFDEKSILDSRADLMFTIEYRKLISPCIVRTKKIINLHAGILPKYRGFSSNAWAIINGENEIGYTIHEMNEKMDDGAIYFTKKIPISCNQTYSDVHELMIESIYKDVPDVLYNIAMGKLGSGIKQTGERIYGHKISKEMGRLVNFDNYSRFFCNLYRCMAPPLGTGVSFAYKGKVFHINKVFHGEERNVSDYIGIPGKIVNIEDDELWIKTRDNVIILKGISDEKGEVIDIRDFFMIGNRI